MYSRIKTNCKQSYFNSKISSVNLRFSNQLLCNNFSLMMQRQCSDGILVSFCVIAALYSMHYDEMSQGSITPLMLDD